MANYSPLCERCIKRLVDCERFYQEMVEQCEDYADDDFDFSAKVVNASSSYDPFAPDIPTGNPKVNPNEEPEAEVGEKQEEQVEQEQPIYTNPIDNSKFFGNIFSAKGRIGRIQYLVHTIIALIVANLFSVAIVYLLNFSATSEKIMIYGSTILFAILMYCAGAKRCNDSNLGGFLPVATILPAFPWFHHFDTEQELIRAAVAAIFAFAAYLFLLIKKGDDGTNEHGTEPLKKY